MGRSNEACVASIILITPDKATEYKTIYIFAYH